MTHARLPQIAPAAAETGSTWTLADSERLYGIPAWGLGAFRATESGHLAVFPDGDPARGIDLFELVESLREREINPPILIRLYDVLAARLREIRRSFDAAIAAHGYRAKYRCLYPIKVNQERHLCEEIRDLALELDFGLEAGSKPELLAVLGLTAGHPEVPIMCNGFKDEEFLETVTLAAKLGHHVMPIVENPHELDIIIAQARSHGIRPRIGVRMKLHSRGTGRWKTSGGAGSKFGLSAAEVLSAVDKLQRAGMADCLHLVHCHVGSQVRKLDSLRNPLQELSRFYVELVGMGTGVKAIDVGGGLGVDYQGSRSGKRSSVDYRVSDYANLVISVLREVCDAATVPHPDVYSESGRAMVAHSSMLVVDVLEQRRTYVTRAQIEAELGTPTLPQAIEELRAIADNLSAALSADDYRRAVKARDRVLQLFRAGKVGLRLRALADELYAAITREHIASLRNGSPVATGKRKAAEGDDLYIANFSLFQSVPDSWALGQVFPICPLHRLNEQPTRSAVLGDITCDSDGKIDRFAGQGDGVERRSLAAHELRPGEPYYLGIFLVGAYQEILGDLHNMFGDTHCVHVRLDEDGQWMLEDVVWGETVREILGYLHYDADELLERLRREVEAAIRQQKITVAEGKGLLSNFALGLSGYTYLE
jgi:arginine decarboxylase